MRVAEIIRRFGTERGDHAALKWGDDVRTYAELDARSSQVAQALRARGVRPGDRVAHLDKNAPEHAELLFGAAKLGAVLTPLNHRLAKPEIEAICADAEASVLVAGPEFADVVADLSPIIAGEPYEAWIGAQPAEDPGHAPTDDEVVYQLYSSGTTGRPKGVGMTNANVRGCVQLYEPRMGLDRDAMNLICLPLFHIGGGGWLVAGLYVGATNVLMREPVPDRLVELIERERVTHTTMVPALFAAMLAVPGVGARDFSALKGMLYGAAPISEALLDRVVGTFRCELLQAYGLTETTGTVMVLPAEDHDPAGDNKHRLRSVGLPVNGASRRIVDPATLQDVAQGDIGEILIQGPTVVPGYWNNPELTAEVMVDGWFRTGDIGYLDADGYLYLHDRVKDMIVSGGENVYPAEIESALASHDAVADVAVIGVPHERWGETPKALVVRSGDVTEQELIAHCRERLAGYKCPSSVEWRDELPRTPTGKLLKKDLRKPFWEGQDREVA